MRKELPFEFAGQECVALSERAMYWPSLEALVIADPHFGKAASFRSVGVGVPETTKGDIARLDQLIAAHRPRSLIVLGDLLHAKSGRVPAVMEALATWRRSHSQLHILLVRGNHDVRAADPPAEMAIEVVGGPVEINSMWLAHDPEELGERIGMAGHVHPCLCLRDDAMHMERLACWRIGKTSLLLPAFGAFTGKYTVRLEPGESAIVAAGEHLARIDAGVSPKRNR